MKSTHGNITVVSVIETGSYLADTGAADAYVIAFRPAITAYTDGLKIKFKATNANTGASTVNANSIGVISLLKNVDEALTANDILAGAIIEAEYSGGNFIVTSGLIMSEADFASEDFDVTGSPTFPIINIKESRVNEIANTPRITAITSSATPTPSADTTDQFDVTALAANATFGAPTGTPANGQSLLYRITSDSSVRTLSWNAIFRASTDFALPTATVASKTFYIQFVYNSTATKWDAVGLTSWFT